MRLIDRYICREAISHALLGLAVVTFVFYVRPLVQIMDLVVRYGNSLGTTLLLLACPLPGVLSFSLPISVLVGVLIGLSRLGSDSELVAMNSLGMSRRQLLVPIGIFALAGTLLTLGNTLWLVPRSLDELNRLEYRLLNSQTSLDIEPRVFLEEFKNLVLYVEDSSASGRNWRGVFLAQTSAGGVSNIQLARSAELVPRRGADTLQLHLREGASYSFDPSHPEILNSSTFKSSDLALSLAGANARPAAEPTPPRESIRQLLATRGPEALEARVELDRRFAFPAACLAFAFLALGVGARPGQTGRALGFVLTLALLAGYYLVFIIGVGKARQGALPPWLGVWLANIASLSVGGALLFGIDRAGQPRWLERIGEWRGKLGSAKRETRAPAVLEPGCLPLLRRMARFPLLMDLCLLRDFLSYFAITAVGFLLLIEVFTFFELLDDIARHQPAPGVVANYFVFLAPLLFYQLAPLAALIATLATLAVMNKNNEVTAYKASGVSLYRLSVPLVAAGLLLAVGLFALDATVLPYASRKQDALRNEIRGRPAQTYFQPSLHWIFGRGDKIYNYELYDADKQLFAGLNVFELDPQTFALRRRVYARQADWQPALHSWVLEQGWIRDFRDKAPVDYRPFNVTTLPEVSEPPSYFQREILQSYQMTWRQLGNYIHQLHAAGFDVSRLSVEWQRKFAFPLLAAIIILIGIPFPFLIRTRGAIGGLALGVGIGIVYWATADLFEAMGAVGQLPPVVAGWAPDLIFLFAGLYFYLKMPT